MSPMKNSTTGTSTTGTSSSIFSWIPLHTVHVSYWASSNVDIFVSSCCVTIFSLLETFLSPVKCLQRLGKMFPIVNIGHIPPFTVFWSLVIPGCIDKAYVE
jgi:hypothetical protein